MCAQSHPTEKPRGALYLRLDLRGREAFCRAPDPLPEYGGGLGSHRGSRPLSVSAGLVEVGGCLTLLLLLLVTGNLLREPVCRLSQGALGCQTRRNIEW